MDILYKIWIVNKGTLPNCIVSIVVKSVGNKEQK